MDLQTNNVNNSLMDIIKEITKRKYIRIKNIKNDKKIRKRSSKIFLSFFVAWTSRQSKSYTGYSLEMKPLKNSAINLK